MLAIGIGTFVPSLPEIITALQATGSASTTDANSSPSSSSSNSVTSTSIPPSMKKLPPNIVPIYKECIADLETPVSTFLKVRAHAREVGAANAGYAFLLESVEGGERLARHSFVGSAPHEVLVTNSNNSTTNTNNNDQDTTQTKNALSGDPMTHLQSAMEKHVVLSVPSIKLPPFTGGAVGYVSYDAIKYFEPKTAASFAHQGDSLDGIPEAAFMMCDTLVIFDHVRHTIKIVAHARIPEYVASAFIASTSSSSSTETASALLALQESYTAACGRIDALLSRLSGPIPSGEVTPFPAATPVPPSSPARNASSSASSSISSASSSSSSSSSSSAFADSFDWETCSNVKQAGYEAMVKDLKSHIVEGDIIQAVPSQRITRHIPEGNPVTALDIYRQLRVVNPSPYMFYLELGPDFQIVGASPEMLVKVDTNGTIYTHPIAGTRKRGATQAQDDELAAELLADAKERAEHIMLVDLGRNDIGRVAAPGSVRVDSLMHIERYSHVMHIVSNVSGTLAPNKTAYDAFRSIFPAGTVSGAPKVMAVDLVARLEPHRRGVYAGAVGYVGYSGVMDTAIAIRTLVVRGKSVHLQAGAGIVHDSVPTLEYEETVSKLRATMRAVDAAFAAGEGTRWGRKILEK